MREFTISADVKSLDTVIGNIDDELMDIEASEYAVLQLMVAVEEIFVNIVHHAYDEKGGDVTIVADVLENPLRAVINFYDKGIPYNPLERDDPDTSLSAEERDAGGLGVFIVKKQMTSVKYKYERGMNVLTIVKNISH